MNCHIQFLRYITLLFPIRIAFLHYKRFTYRRFYITPL